MPLKMPNITRSGCVNFTACGQIKTKDKELLDWLDKQDTNDRLRVATIKKGGKRHFIRASISGKHFHIDVATREYFAEIPKATITMSEFERLVDKVKGQEVSLRLEGDYFVPDDDLPLFIHSSMVTSKVQGGVVFRMTGGSISVTGSPISRITWASGFKRGTRITLVARTDGVINDTYLASGMSLIDAAFNAFIAKKDIENAEAK